MFDGFTVYTTWHTYQLLGHDLLDEQSSSTRMICIYHYLCCCNKLWGEEIGDDSGIDCFEGIVTVLTSEGFSIQSIIVYTILLLVIVHHIHSLLVMRNFAKFFVSFFSSSILSSNENSSSLIVSITLINFSMQ